MKRRLARLLIRSFIIVILLPFSIYLLVATNIGLQSTAWFAQRFIPGLENLKVQGRLIGPIAIQDFNYHHKEVAIELKQGVIDWHPSTLLTGRLVIEKLQANDLIITVLNTKVEKQEKQKKQSNFTWLTRLYINSIQLPDIIIEPSHLQLKLQGSLTDNWHLQWQAQLLPRQHSAAIAIEPGNNKLESILQSLSGKLMAHGAIQGAKLTPRINAIINATDLTVEQMQAAKLQINIATDLTPAMSSTLTASASQLKYKDYLFDTVNLQVQGQVNSTLAINWQLHGRLTPTMQYRGNISAQGSMQGDYKTPTITTTVNAQQVRLKDIHFANLKAQLNADFAENSQSHLQVNVNGLQLKNYQFAPIQLNALLDRAQQALVVQIAKGSLRYQVNQQMRTLTWQPSAVTIYQQTKDLMVKGRLILNAQQYLDINLQLPNYQFLTPLLPQQPIQGKLSLYVQQIAPFFGAVKEIENVRGLLHADLDVAGSYAKPRLTGAIILENASAEVPSLNLHIRNIQLKVQGSPNGILAWNGQAQSGQGILKIKGNTELQQQDFPTTVTLKGDNITVSDTAHYQIVASPDLQAKYAEKRLTLTGVIKLPHTNIDLGGGNGQAVTLSKDVVFVGDEQKKTAYELPFYAKVQLIAGDDIHLYYEGLKTQLRGQLLINETPNSAVTGVGQIDFYKGVYTYYGQTLTIRPDSKVIFNGLVENPVLNIQAIKHVEVIPDTPTSAGDIVPASTELSSSVTLPGSGQALKVIVGVKVQGNAKNPDISLFSEPAILKQTDILSYLVTGSPASQLSSAGASALFNAASSLNFGGTSQLKDMMQELQKTVGVDVNIQSSSYLNPETNQAQQNTSVVVGKKLSPKIYISYSVGILEALNTFQIRYFLSKYWTLQSTNSSLGSGVDLLYMIERGK